MISLGEFLTYFKKDTMIMLYENDNFILMTKLYYMTILDNHLHKGVNTCKCTHFYPADDDQGCFDCLVIDLMPFPI